MNSPYSIPNYSSASSSPNVITLINVISDSEDDSVSTYYIIEFLLCKDSWECNFLNLLIKGKQKRNEITINLQYASSRSFSKTLLSFYIVYEYGLWNLMKNNQNYQFLAWLKCQ